MSVAWLCLKLFGYSLYLTKFEARYLSLYIFEIIIRKNILRGHMFNKLHKRFIVAQLFCNFFLIFCSTPIPVSRRLSCLHRFVHISCVLCWTNCNVQKTPFNSPFAYLWVVFLLGTISSIPGSSKTGLSHIFWVLCWSKTYANAYNHPSTALSNICVSVGSYTVQEQIPAS